MSDREHAVGAGWVSRKTLAKTALGFVVAGLLVYLLGVAIGWDRTIERLRTAQIEWVALACLSSLLCLAAWGKTWQILLETLGVSVPYRKLVVTYLAATFANYVTPMGQAGGEPFIAYVLSRDTGISYEKSLASVVATHLIRLLPFFTVGGIGIGYLVANARLVSGPTELFALLFVAIAVGVPPLAVVGWRFRERVREAVLRGLAPVARRTERVSLASVRDRIDRLFSSLEAIGGSPRALIAATALSYAGWILFVLPLYFAGLALGTHVPVLLACFVVPVGVVASMTPLPGGLAAIEGATVVLLTALTALSTADALAVTALYRLASYWFVVAVGGAAALWVLKRV